MPRFWVIPAALCALLLPACGGGEAAGVRTPTSIGSTAIQQLSGSLRSSTLGSQTIKHIVIMVQENRSVDNLFNGFPGADTVRIGKASGGATIPLQPIDLATSFDPNHNHQAWTTEYREGAMDGFNLEQFSGYGKPPKHFAYSYVPQAQVQPYWTMAKSYAFADNMFATNEGPSYPAHLYLAAGTSAIDRSDTLYAMDNAILAGSMHPGGCDSLPGTTVRLIDPRTGDQGAAPIFPCIEHQTIWDLLDAKRVTWKWYEARFGRGLWFAPDTYKHIRYGPDYANVSAPNTKILADIKNGQLPGVSWVIPTAAESDHAISTDGSGPAWVAQVVNAIGLSPYWKSTAIFVTWDDWGGWYDHVAPIRYNHYELGFRVPLIAISPYTKPGYVSHVQHEFGSILKFTEGTFGLGSLNTTDVRADDLSDLFNFAQSALVFKTIPAARVPATASKDTRIPDDDEK